MRYVQTNDIEHVQALVPCNPYIEEQFMEPYNHAYEGPQGKNFGTSNYFEPPAPLDFGTLMYMARNPMRYQRNQPNRNQMGCHGCGANDN